MILFLKIGFALILAVPFFYLYVTEGKTAVDLSATLAGYLFTLLAANVALRIHAVSK